MSFDRIPDGKYIWQHRFMPLSEDKYSVLFEKDHICRGYFIIARTFS